MFARTVSAGLGEVRPPPSSAQCLRAASTAGALLAGYFPHLRGAFRFPSHLASLPLPGDVCSTATGQQNPQIASLLSAQAKLPCKADAPLLDQTPAKDGTSANIETVRSKVVATLLDKEYRPRIQRLEDTCMALQASKLQWASDAQRALEQSQRTRELNRRLCRELNDVRSERTLALEELQRLKQQLERTHKDVEQTRCENASLRGALQDSQQQVLNLTLCSSEANSTNDTQTERSNAKSCAGVSSTKEIECTFSNEPQAELSQQDDRGCARDSVCTCNDHLSWGCPIHRVYSDSLMLAHRDVASRISRGPPGLEPEAPPGLECMFAEMRGPPFGRLHLMPAC